jgi:hypothetical protein
MSCQDSEVEDRQEQERSWLLSADDKNAAVFRVLKGGRVGPFLRRH